MASKMATIPSESGPGPDPASSRPSELSATAPTDFVGMATGVADGQTKDVIIASRASGVGDSFQAARLSRAASAGSFARCVSAAVVSRREASWDLSGDDRDVSTVARVPATRTSANNPARIARLPTAHRHHRAGNDGREGSPSGVGVLGVGGADGGLGAGIRAGACDRAWLCDRDGAGGFAAAGAGNDAIGVTPGWCGCRSAGDACGGDAGSVKTVSAMDGSPRRRTSRS